MFVLVSFSHAQVARAQDALICEATGKVDGIVTLHAEEAFPEQQVCVMKNSTTIHCAAGTFTSKSIEISSDLQNGIGTTKVVLEINGDSYRLVKTFDCDWINGEEHCSMGEPTQTLATETISCSLVRE